MSDKKNGHKTTDRADDDVQIWRVVLHAPADGTDPVTLRVRAGYCTTSERQVTLGLGGRPYPGVFTSGSVWYAVREDALVDEGHLIPDGPYAALCREIAAELGIDLLVPLTAEQHAEFSERFRAAIVAVEASGAGSIDSRA